jgi:hypothetical protein
MAKPSRSQPEPVILRENCIVGGRFFPAGAPVPFATEEALPPSLRHLVVRGGEVFFNSAARNIYENPDPSIQPDPLPREVEEELRDIASKRSGLLRAQMETRQADIDAFYAAEEARAKAALTKYYVRRGGEWGAVERSNLKPGEPVFVRRENGEMEIAGHIDSQGGWPEPEIIT